ncbi:serine/threonine-protein kinase tousled-like 1 [Orbicella faveolata]|uniref:serine/threonine-protein kinase tousled-like 1 n=1 Tax=Orbicella faveolata TaxID=48498 RepID=UPI0009E26392|nr:serine/threonine-protein kinase tousled-like 1 [Orbicella faveolata]
MTEEPVDAFVNTANDVFQQAGDIKQTQQNSSEMLDIDDFNTVDVSSFEIQPTFMKFLEQAYKNKLREIEEAHGVKIIRNENATQVQIHSSEILNNPHSYQEGCDAFIDLYQKLFPNVSLEVIDLKSADDKALIIEAIKAIESENPVIIEMRRDNKLQVFGERNNITSSVQALKEKLGSLQGGSRKTRHSQRNTNLSAREPQTSQEDRFSVLQQLLIHGVKFSLYQRDITDERVDAIVNAANHVLQHDGGVAAAIVRKGGRQIEEESRQIMLHRNNRPLNEGDAVYTKGGNLSCRYVIHTVSPRWNDHYRQRNISLLRRACMESLCLAAELKLSSIALPAISSGILGTPKSICAQVMFQAVEEFSSNTDPKFSTLRDVRIAIIDDETINVFREEFVKRYTYQETSPSTKGSPLKERSEVSNVAPSAKPLSGRGRGICATSFYGRPYEEVGSKPSGSIQLANTGGTKSANAVRGLKEYVKRYTSQETSPSSKGSPLKKRSEVSNVVTSARPLSGRERGICATSFYGRPYEEVGSKPSGSIQLANTGGTKSANAVRGLKEYVKRYTSQETSPSSKGSPLKKRSEVSNVVTSARPLSGRERGICATSFYGRPYEEVGSKPSGSIQLANTGGTKSANAVRAPRNPIVNNTTPVIEKKMEEAGLVNTSEIPTEKQDSKQMKQGSGENNNWPQVQSDVAQVLQALDDEKRASNIGEQELRLKETDLVRTLKGNLREEQQARTRVLEELSQARIACNELQGRMQNELAQIRQTLENEIRLRDTRERQLREKETIVEQLQYTLSEEQRVRTKLEERLQVEMLSSQARQQEFQIKENASREQQRLLEEERQQKTALEERLRDKETIIDQLQNTLGEEQQVRTRLEERLQTEMLSGRVRQQELQTKESANREQQRLLEEERQQKTTLEERLRSLELQMQEERNRYLSNEGELQSAVTAAQEELAEYQRRQPRDWIIRREEVLPSARVLGKGAWGEVREGTFRGCQVAVKEIHEVILSAHNRRLFEREMNIASCCRHPNLLQFIGATNDDGNPLFVTEILDTSLRRLLSERALNDEEIVSLALDVAKGLNYLHFNRPLPIIHRDISSANVLLWRRDECWRAKLSDYGSANFMRQCMTVNPGAIIYSAPEALTSQQSPKVDVYSFGLLLCEMCVRELPVPQEVHCQISQVSNGALRGLIEQCVKRDPEERPSMSDIIYELEQLVQAESI